MSLKSCAIENIVGIVRVNVTHFHRPLNMIRDMSLKIAVRVMEKAQEQGLSGIPYPPDLSQFVAQNIWSPTYFEAK